MTNLIAKPIVKNQLWVITDGVNKIGNIEVNSSHTGFNVKIGDNVNFFSTTKSIEKNVQLVFEKPTKAKKAVDLTYAQWPTDSKTYNNFYDVTRKIHVYTKTPASKCYHVAGYFNIELNGAWQTVFCPKYIFIQRYNYNGPYTTDTDAKQELNT